MPNQRKVNEARLKRAALLHKFEELGGTVAQHEELLTEPVADAVDLLVSCTDRELAVARLEEQRKILLDVRAALVKLGNGDYGICEACETPIPGKRLDALPWARLCIACQEQFETQLASNLDFGVAA